MGIDLQYFVSRTGKVTRYTEQVVVERSDGCMNVYEQVYGGSYGRTHGPSYIRQSSLAERTLDEHWGEYVDQNTVDPRSVRDFRKESTAFPSQRVVFSDTVYICPWCGISWVVKNEVAEDAFNNMVLSVEHMHFLVHPHPLLQFRPNATPPSVDETMENLKEHLKVFKQARATLLASVKERKAEAYRLCDTCRNDHSRLWTNSQRIPKQGVHYQWPRPSQRLQGSNLEEEAEWLDVSKEELRKLWETKRMAHGVLCPESKKTLKHRAKRAALRHVRKRRRSNKPLSRREQQFFAMLCGAKALQGLKP